MKFLLDTNVVSEATRPAPSAEVLGWLREQPVAHLAISTLVLGEISSGVARMAPGRRREAFSAWLEHDLPDQFGRRVLAVDRAVAYVWGQLRAEGSVRGRPLPVIDGLMLATASVHDLVFVTRNIRDCADRGVPLLDPWTGVED